MEIDWNGHKLKVRGDWTARWLYLCPDYELWLDDEKLDRQGGPNTHPKLEAIVEDEDGEIHHISAEVTSIIGFAPDVEFFIEGELVEMGTVKVENRLNPILVLMILLSVGVMLWLGPEVLGRYL